MTSDLEQLIKECKQYHKPAQRILYERYAPLMRGVCFRYAGDPDTLNDVVQEGFIKLFSNIRKYSGNGSFEGWMKRVFINTTISYLRKYQKKKETLKLDEVEESELSENGSIPILEKPEYDKNDIKDGQIDFQFVLSADWSEKELLNALEKLPDKYRIVFNLFFIENFKHEEIAELLEIDETTSRTRLLRARQYMQKELLEMSKEKLSINS